MMPLPMVLATAVPGEGAREVEDGRHQHGVRRAHDARGHDGGDGVGRVVKPLRKSKASATRIGAAEGDSGARCGQLRRS